MKLISRNEAVSKGLTRYFTGVLCVNSHRVERLVSNSACVLCSAAYKKKWEIKNPDYYKQWYEANKEKHRHTAKLRKLRKKDQIKEQSRDYHYRRTYGITTQDYNQMVKAQKSVCLICKETARLVVDHCHSTGIIRGLLCSSCNTGLGYMRDNPTILRQAADYLEAFRDREQTQAATAAATA